MKLATALLFPGQGAYLPGVLAPLAERYPGVRGILDPIDEVAKIRSNGPISTLLLDPAGPTIDQLVDDDPTRLYLATFASSMALYEVLTVERGLSFDVLVGHSLGEVSALCAAGALRLEDGARLVAEATAAFGRLGQRPGGMLDLEVDEARTEHLLAAVGTRRVEVAAVNAPTQTVVSGPDDELMRVESAARATAIETYRVRAPFPFHSNMMCPVAADVAYLVARIPIHRPRTRVYSPTAQSYYWDEEDVRDGLTSYLIKSVRFIEAVHDLHASGVDTFVECGARSVLAELVVRSIPGVTIHSPLRRRVHIMESLDATIKGVDRGVGRQHSSAVPRPPHGTNANPAEDVRVPTSALTGLPTRSDIIEILRNRYSMALDYPVEVITDDIDLVDELGVDSVKEVEIFAGIRRELGLPAPGNSIHPADFRTLSAIADALIALATRHTQLVG